jgi:hypothetical protein
MLGVDSAYARRDETDERRSLEEIGSGARASAARRNQRGTPTRHAVSLGL